MRIPCRFLLAAAAALALGGLIPASATPALATAVAASAGSGATVTTPGGLLASLPDPAATADDFDGSSVAVSGNLAAVGNGGVSSSAQNGVVYLYQRTASGWPTTPKVTLHDPQGAPFDGFGGGLAALAGRTVVVGAPLGGANGGGAVYIYTKTASGWPATPTMTLQDPTANPNPFGDEFGWSVAVSANAIIVGSIGSGTQYTYFASGGVWPASPSVITPNPDPAGCDSFGSSVATSGVTAVVGCEGNSTSPALAFIEHLGHPDRGTGVVIVATLPDPAATAGDFFGHSVSVSGNNVVVAGSGSPGPNNVYVYTKTTSGWPSAPTVTIPDPAGTPGDNFGISASVSGTHIAVGDNTTEAVYLYGQLDGAWAPVPEATIPAPGGDPTSDFAQDVSLSGATLIVGAPDTNTASGAAYLFSTS